MNNTDGKLQDNDPQRTADRNQDAVLPLVPTRVYDIVGAKELFRQLFSGRDVAHGVSRGDAVSTVLAPAREAEFARHLDGDGHDVSWSLGLNPLRADNTVLFAALDLDAKGLTDDEADAVVAQADELHLPLCWTRSRSGGLHGWLFLEFPGDPKVVKRLLHSWGERLGWHVKSSSESKGRGDRFFEVFPKQEHLGATQPGNWIRLPWPGGDAATRRRGLQHGESTPTFDAWIRFAAQRRVSPNKLIELIGDLGSGSISTDAPRVPGATGVIDANSTSSAREPNVTVADARDWLSRLDEDRLDDYELWVQVLMALHHQFAETPDEADAIAGAIEWSSGSAKYQAGDVESKWRSFKHNGRDLSITIRSLRRWAGVDELERAVLMLNGRFAHVLVGGGAILCTPPSGEPTFLDSPRWKEHLANRKVRVGDRDVQLAKAWLDHPRRRSYHSIAFDPTAEPYSAVPSLSGFEGESDFNLWPGFALKPSKAGTCDLFLKHVQQQICDENDELDRWVIQFLAHIVQAPTRLSGTALALRGPQGVGKSIVGEIFGEILGPRLYTKVSRAEELTGRFNAHQHGRLLLQVEEGFWAGDKKAEGALKHMITSPTVRLERKFLDPIDTPNYARLLITSNNSWVVPAGFGERRFAVINVRTDRANDREYFAALRRQMFEEGGCARLFDYLLHDIEVDWAFISRPPKTTALLEQQLESLSAEDRWLFEVLSEGLLPGDPSGEGRADIDIVFQHFKTTLRDGGRGWGASKQRLGQLLTQRLGDGYSIGRPSGSGSRPRQYRFASLTECRRRFADQLGISPAWQEPHVWRAPLDDMQAA